MKTVEIRLQESIEIQSKLKELGLDTIPKLRELKQIMNEYVRNGTSASGKIKVPEINKTAHYLFSNQTHIVSHVNLTTMF